MMDRQDREALYMILERNGRREVDKVLDDIRRRDWEAVEEPEVKKA